MTEDWLTFAIGTLIAIFAIVNPLGAMTFFVALTKGYTKKLRRRVVDKAVLAATLTLVIFAFVGRKFPTADRRRCQLSRRCRNNWRGVISSRATKASEALFPLFRRSSYVTTRP